MEFEGGWKVGRIGKKKNNIWSKWMYRNLKSPEVCDKDGRRVVVARFMVEVRCFGRGSIRNKTLGPKNVLFWFSRVCFASVVIQSLVASRA